MYIYLICGDTNTIYSSKTILKDSNVKLLEITDKEDQIKFWSDKLHAEIVTSYKKPSKKKSSRKWMTNILNGDKKLVDNSEVNAYLESKVWKLGK